jgi:hypothetical protein
VRGQLASAQSIFSFASTTIERPSGVSSASEDSCAASPIPSRQLRKRNELSPDGCQV